MIHGTMMENGSKRQANVTVTSGRKELSLCVDNGALGRTDKLFRSDIRLFHDGKDVTGEVFGFEENSGWVVRGDVENMDRAMRWLRRSAWGFDMQSG